MAKFIKGMAAGILVGAAAEMVLMPCCSRKTQRKMKKVGNKIRNIMEDTCDNMYHIGH